MARARRATPYAVLLAGFATLLHRLTGETDLLIGTPVTGRGRPELAPLIGMFVNTLVLRVDCAGDPGLGELVDRVRGTVLDALDNQEVPYDHLVKTLAPDRDASGSPLHRVVFNLLPGVVSDDVGTGTAKVDLLVDLGERPDGYVGRLEYRRDMFDEAAATALTERLLRLLEAGLADLDTPIGRLPLLDPAERRQLLAGPVATGTPASVLDMFAERVAADPELTAVADATGEQLTYRALDERANRLARHLARVAPIRPDARVALLVDGGVDLAVAVLAVLKAGAAYVPLDPKNPPERLRRLIADSGAVAVVTASGRDEHGLPAVDLRGDAASIAAQPPDAPEGRPHPDALAYVTYTSGSTGEPKGVGVAHRNLAAYVDGVRPLLDTAPGRSFAQLQSLVFDFGATVFYGALLTGGTLHLVTELATDPHGLADYLRRHRVDLMKITPSHLRALLAGRPDPAALLPRRTLVLGGEGSDWAWVRDLRQGRAVVNHYGPTETTVGAVALAAGADPADAGTTTPLGRPLAHAAAYVLDEHGQPVPDAVCGELWLGGATVSRGYLGRPALTADRFRPDPFGGQPGARLYRTGDRARRLPGGELEFLGRLDDQVKIRGYRVEPGEVRQVIAAAPGVVDCAVVARPQGLVAYVVGSTVDLPAFAAALLPDHMVPAAFVALDELPRAAHGKVDHARLPDPDSTAAGAGAGPATQAPVGDTEELIAGLFTALLGHGPIGRHDGFFALGGHSLLAIQLVSRLRAALGVALPVRAVFEEPTVAGLAAKVAQRRRKALTLPAITPVPRDAPLPASYGQRRLWFLDQLETGAAVYNTSLYLEIDGALDVELLRRALTAIVERHELLRTQFVDRDGELWQVVRDEAELPFTVVTEPDDAEGLLREHADRRFDLAVEPPLRALLLRLTGGRHQLLVAVHHVANDAWSADLFARELGEHYAALRAGRPAALPALPVQYADYAAWQHRVVAGELGETQLRYWRERLAGLPEQLTVPADRPRPARRGTAGALAPSRCRRRPPTGCAPSASTRTRRCSWCFWPAT
ncbi:amino acid adenylation domain-containing protein [Phytohabitans flavus]|uniref:amino acid adenylation domain-containing protein n=1 Tax=Phytohabitans flavus TaxID=1076124 RepID=UPI00363EC7DA